MIRTVKYVKTSKYVVYVIKGICLTLKLKSVLNVMSHVSRIVQIQIVDVSMTHYILL